MKRYKNLIYSFLCFLFLCVMFSCNDGFEEMNTDPYSPLYIGDGESSSGSGIDLSPEISEDELTKLKENETTSISFFNTFTYEGMYNDYQRTTNVTHDIYSAYFANNNPIFNEQSPSYVYTEGWSMLRWNHFYQDRCKEYSTLAKTFYYVDYPKYMNAFYITRIYLAFLASVMTDTYGDIPFSVFLRAEKTPEKLPYDTQEEVYDMIFRVLEQSTDSIVPGACPFKFDQSTDKCYQGNEEKWLRFANSLRLRLALRISNIDPDRAKKEGEAALNHIAGLMRDDADNMKTIPRYSPIDLGGDNSGGDENIHALCSFKYLDVCMSKDIELAYRNQSSAFDPRCGVCWFRPTPIDALKTGFEFPFMEYNGCEVGNNNVSRNSEEYSVLKCNEFEGKILNNEYWYGYSRESVWMSYAESRFLLAEASLRGWYGAPGTPQAYFEQGIRASMHYYKISESDINDYISGLSIYHSGTNPFAGADKEAMLEQIISQKWLAIFPNGTEGWAEFRRTDYPALRNHLNNRSFDVPLGKFIKRLQYPTSEFDYNYDNMPKNVNQGVRVWWDVSDTNDNTGTRMSPDNFR